MSFSTPSTRWAALTTRNPLAHSAFVYTVRTTNVYCRPTCPARLARRANVGFHTTAAEAAAAGFRACKRCKPDAAEDEKDATALAFEKACKIIVEAVERGEGARLGLKELAGQVGLSPRYFHRVFKERMGVTPRGYVRLKEVELAALRGLEGGEGDSAIKGEEDVVEGGLEEEDFDFGDLVNEEMMTSEKESIRSSEGITTPLHDGDLIGVQFHTFEDAAGGKQPNFFSTAITFEELAQLDPEAFRGFDVWDPSWMDLEHDYTTGVPLAPHEFDSGNSWDPDPFILP